LMGLVSIKVMMAWNRLMKSMNKFTAYHDEIMISGNQDFQQTSLKRIEMYYCNSSYTMRKLLQVAS
jgi:hypothetical protein